MFPPGHHGRSPSWTHGQANRLCAVPPWPVPLWEIQEMMRSTQFFDTANRLHSMEDQRLFTEHEFRELHVIGGNLSSSVYVHPSKTTTPWKVPPTIPSILATRQGNLLKLDPDPPSEDNKLTSPSIKSRGRPCRYRRGWPRAVR